MLSQDVRMRSTSVQSGGPRRAAFLCLLLAIWMMGHSAGAGSQSQSRSKTSPSPRIDLRPKLVPGEVLRYQVQLQTITDTKRTGAISDPQGPSRLTVTWDATIKLEVLGEPAPAAARFACSEIGCRQNIRRGIECRRGGFAHPHHLRAFRRQRQKR